ncbi:MAG: hypothetical protein ACQERR_07540 [Pseudomonadota bacterium]
MEHSSRFQQLYHGALIGILRWHQLDAFWERLRADPEGWYVYQVGEAVPDEPLPAAELPAFLEELDALLRHDHREDFCGIVYVDDREAPTFVKVYDPNNLGASCGSSGRVIPPRWLLSRVPPEAVAEDGPTPGNRRRWWQRLLAPGGS